MVKGRASLRLFSSCVDLAILIGTGEEEGKHSKQEK
jgi:hypothetical protein